MFSSKWHQKLNDLLKDRHQKSGSYSNSNWNIWNLLRLDLRKGGTSPLRNKMEVAPLTSPTKDFQDLNYSLTLTNHRPTWTNLKNETRRNTAVTADKMRRFKSGIQRKINLSKVKLEFGANIRNIWKAAKTLETK